MGFEGLGVSTRNIEFLLTRGLSQLTGRTQRLWDEWGQQASPGAAARTKRAARRRPLTPGFAFRYGQLEVRVTVFEVIGIPGAVGTLSESAEVPVAVAE